MFDARQLLDAVVGAVAKAGQPGGAGAVLERALDAVNRSGVRDSAEAVLDQAVGGLKDAAGRANAATGGLGQSVDQAASQALASGSQVLSSGPAADAVARVRGAVAANPALAQAAVAGLAGLLLTNRRTRGVAASAAGLGGLALIGGLAYRAFQNHQAGKPLMETAIQAGQATAATTPGPGPTPSDVDAALAEIGSPDGAASLGISAAEDDALLYLRAMVAAVSADGRVDAAERSRLMEALGRAGIDEEATRWLERELEEPADVEELAAGVTDPRKAAQVYTAARVAIDPDTMQEREFLRQLAESLDLDQGLKAQIDATATLVKQ